MRIKTSNDSIINVDSVKNSITIEGVEFGSDCRALVSRHKDGTGTMQKVKPRPTKLSQTQSQIILSG